MSSSNQFELAEPPSESISAVAFAPTNPTRLLVSSWDRHVYLYDTSEGDSGALLLKVEHHAPVLDICFSDDNTAYSACLDWEVTKIDLETGRKTELSTHDEGVKSVVYSEKHGILISGSWDQTLHVHVLENGELACLPAVVLLPSKPYDLSLTQTKLVVAMASRAIFVYDLATLKSHTMQAKPVAETEGLGLNLITPEPSQQRESSLKMMTRAVACSPDDTNYATSSIDGRIAVDMFDPSAESQARKYAFKCHRQTEGDADVVYPVNALAFHPVRQTTFASGGGDGFVVLWDGKSKRRIRQYQPSSISVASMSWNVDGRLLAIGVSPGFVDGKEETETGESKVIIRKVADSETKGKGS